MLYGVLCRIFSPERNSMKELFCASMVSYIFTEVEGSHLLCLKSIPHPEGFELQKLPKTV